MSDGEILMISEKLFYSRKADDQEVLRSPVDALTLTGVEDRRDDWCLSVRSLIKEGA